MTEAGAGAGVEAEVGAGARIEAEAEAGTGVEAEAGTGTGAGVEFPLNTALFFWNILRSSFPLVRQKPSSSKRGKQIKKSGGPRNINSFIFCFSGWGGVIY